MTKREFNKKYDEVIRAIAIAHETDLFTGSDMLKYEIRCHAGRVQRGDTYKGVPENFDWQQAIEDMDSITD